MNKHGSALYIVVFTTAIIGFTLGAWWYRSSLHIDVAVAREAYYRNFYAAEVVLQYGVALIRENSGRFFSKEVRNKMPHRIDVSFLFKNTMQKKLEASLTFSTNAQFLNNLSLVARLIHGSNQDFSLKSTISRINSDITVDSYEFK